VLERTLDEHDGIGGVARSLQQKPPRRADQGLPEVALMIGHQFQPLDRRVVTFMLEREQGGLEGRDRSLSIQRSSNPVA